MALAANDKLCKSYLANSSHPNNRNYTDLIILTTNCSKAIQL
ncbi:hypothetical protein COLO4_28059 [Corchorus olitorius]|uniref:Uncharacterized protein n=1 Tax=Corchorus olitorius TaxID=93759 RepID=A0A1R3HN65_9ROSI|nr:hypothetical protein COLO4_28059 [Corchorus olitorius]